MRCLISLFRCDRCGSIENTALTNYWNKESEAPALCSECDPAMGRWHGVFEKRSAKGMMLASDGFLYSKAELKDDRLKWRMENQGLKMVREIE